jgi:nucleoid-associated protein YgaU
MGAARGATARSTPIDTDYFVQPGDTLSHIAKRWFGDARQWQRIVAVNPQVDPRSLRPGQLLRLPPRDQNAPAKPAPKTASGDRHVVRAGETLSSIARIRLGDPTRWREIYAANRRVIGPDPNRLEVGMELVISEGTKARRHEGTEGAEPASQTPR